MTKLFMLCAFAAGCTNGSMGSGSGNGHSPEWESDFTTVSGSQLVFSPIADSINKFHVASTGEPQLQVFHESTIGTGNCSMLTIPSGAESGSVTWGFRAPDGEYLDRLDLSALVSVDSRADAAASGEITAQADGQEFTLMLATASGDTYPDLSYFDDVISTDKFDALVLTFRLENANDTTALEHIFPQALRQCPGDAIPFELDNSSTGQQ